MRDYQVSRVYRWENAHLPKGPNVKFEHAQAIVNYIWENERLQYPPTVKPFETNVRKWAGTATRFEIHVQPVVTTKTIIHEVAHSMTSNIDGESAWHGPLFVGMYVKLLHKYMGVDLFHLLKTCAVEGVDIDINATPIFVD